jgi:hypothetical protein
MTATDAPGSTSRPSTTQQGPGVQPKRWIPGVVLPLIIAIGVGVFLLSTVRVISETSANLRTAPRLSAPGTIRVHLARGRYALYENVEDAAYPLNPASVTVIGPSGHVRTISATSDLSTTGSPLDTNVYGTVVGFTAPATGNYVIKAASGESTLLVGKSLGALIDILAGWVVGAVAGFLASVVGLVLKIRRMRRARRASLV